MNGADFVVTPALTDIYRFLSKAVKHQVVSAKTFVRWMDGTCRECEPQYAAGDDEEPIVYSYYSDVSQNPVVIKMMLTLNQSIHKSFNTFNKYLMSWKRYETQYGLWNSKKKASLEKLDFSKHSCVYFDTRLGGYERLMEAATSQPSSRDIDFLSVDCFPCAVAVKRQAASWKSDYGRILYEHSAARLRALVETMDGLSRALQLKPEDLAGLKAVLNKIAEVRSMNMDMELEYRDVQERFRTLAAYGIDVDEEEGAAAAALDETWTAVRNLAKTVDMRLVRVKQEFTLVTQRDVAAFSAEVEELQEAFFASGPGAPGTDLDAGLELTASYRKQLADFNRRREQLVLAEKLFGLPISAYPGLVRVKEDLDKLSTIYDLYVEHRDFEESMSNMLWTNLDTTKLTRGAEDIDKKMRRMPKELKEMQAYAAVQRVVLQFKESIPLIQSLKNEAMKPRHWTKLMELTGVNFKMDPTSFTLKNIFQMELHRFGEQIADITNQSMQELKIEQELKRVEEVWKHTSFQLAKYKKDGMERGWVLKSAEEISLELEDHMLNLQTVSGSRFVGHFMELVSKWTRSLNNIAECIEVWFVVQRKWMYLESIFVSDDIVMQLPDEAKKFEASDRKFKSIMTATAKNPNVLEACNADNRTAELRALSDALDRTQKSLSEYLDTKRIAFPRFYFISDDELLSILGSSDPEAVQVHLLKLFSAVKGITFGRGAKTALGMISPRGERFSFRTPAPVDGAVEGWLTAVEEEMVATLRLITKEAVFNYAATDRLQWIEQNLGMVGLVGSQIWWTWEVEDVFRRVRAGNKYAMKELLTKLNGQLGDLVSKVREPLASSTRKKLNTLIIIDVHARDIVDMFVRDSILDAREFAWESQLRFYWQRREDDISIRQCTGVFGYGYEYMGLDGRLVITPLTDRIYMTLTQALTFRLGGSPAGPAGTGKTETCKDLAKAMGVPCFVTNCGEQLDFTAVGANFSGLCQVGAWGCFDEFNRINVEVLSVVSAQLKAIQNSLNYNKATCDIGLGKEIRINQRVGIFITMNPGYAGRTELPDNLKALFRPISVVVPDLLQICEIMLFSEGFETARALAKKMTVLYKLSKEQLSKQYHYDFGLRALKSVLVMAGSLKREYEELPEELVLMRALRDMNMPKFVYEDVPLFMGLIADLFPGMDCPRVGYKALNEAVEQVLEEQGMRHSNEDSFHKQVDKVVQLYEVMLTRHTTMVVGPTGGGKSVNLAALRTAMRPAFDVAVKTFTINPKAQTVNELYGIMDPVTRDWTDGILSKIFREINLPPPPGKENEERWLIFDGDVDAVWVENMNSVMDDNKLLTLPNGERIRLEPHARIFLETFDLQYASPATISRCGMVYVDPKNLGYRPYYERWVKQRFAEHGREEEKVTLFELYDKYVKRSVEYVLEGMLDDEVTERLQQTIPIPNLAMLRQLCSLMDTLLPGVAAGAGGDELAAGGAAAAAGGGGDDSRDDDGGAVVPLGSELDSDQMEGLFVFALMWSVGAALLEESRTKFNLFMQNVYTLGPSGSLYDHVYDPDTRRWTKWDSRVVEYVPPEPFLFYRIMVPTADTTLYTFLLERTMSIGQPVLFVGEPGTAKTTIVQNYLLSQPAEKTKLLNMNFSSRTTSLDVQTIIADNVEKRTGKIYGPLAGKKLLVFVDDLNMPRVDVYGTQQPIALLFFLIGDACMYDRGKELELRLYRDLAYVAAMGPPGGGRNSVDPRFISLFSVFNLTRPEEETLQKIFGSILGTFMEPFAPEVREASGKLTSATLRLYNHVLARLPPTPSKFHYIFNLRDLGRVFEGLCNAVPELYDSGAKLVRLWRNECMRVFSDRLISDKDRESVSSAMAAMTLELWPDASDEVMAEPLCFGDFAGAAERIAEGAEDARLYTDVGDMASVRAVFDAVLENYNIDHKPMTLVLFENALEHLTRIHRILRTPRGNALLVGVGGSGKQSLTRLAAYTAGYSVFQISLARNYGELEFREELKELYTQLGAGPVVFLFTDAHVAEEGFLELVNNMLTTGMVPALYAVEEKDALINGVRDEAEAAGVVPTAENCWAFYVDKCRSNLHIVLAMSPAGETLRRRCRNFPGLVSACVIDWFFPWPEDALTKVATYFLADEALDAEQRSAVIGHMVTVHLSVVDISRKFEEELRRTNHVTPKNYLDYISNYRKQMKENQKRIEASIERLGGGLSKLITAAEDVDQLSAELADKKVVVDEKTTSVERLIEEIGEKRSLASTRQAEATKKQRELEADSAVITEEKAKADSALAEALPALENARIALDALDKNNITEIRAFATPPKDVQAVCMCVVHLRPTGREDESRGWAGARAMMSDANFLNLLKNYNMDRITDRMARKVKAYFRDPDFTVEKMKSKSTAGAGLLQWVVAVVKYYDVAKGVEPLRQRVALMERRIVESGRELARIKDELAQIEGAIVTLSNQYEEANVELVELKEQASVMERRLEAASKLIDGLSSERSRWTKDREELTEERQRLVGDCLLTSAFLSYCGAFSYDYRQRMVYSQWHDDVLSRGLPLTQPFKLETLLVSEAVKQKWIGEGLPGDALSVQNGILTTRASRWPLCIDPQQQAVRWIKSRESASQLVVKTFNDHDFLKHLELCIQFGNPFLMEAVDEELDPVIDPVLEKATYVTGGQRFVRLGDKAVEWDDDFRFYLTSKLSNPAYSPEVSGKTMIINYNVTLQGLQNQLLNVVVGHERPDLEEQYRLLVQEMASNTQVLVELEDLLLRELVNSEGNILDNDSLIATLEDAKTKAVEISAKLEQAKFTNAEIEKARSAYVPAAKRGSILFFAMSGMSNISKMYTISLNSFLDVFNNSLYASKSDVVLDNRLRNILEETTRRVYDYTCMGVFVRHKLMFSFQMTCMIMDGEGELNRTELDFFLKGDVSLEGATSAPPFAWLSISGWKDLLRLPSLGEAWADVVTDVQDNEAAWKSWYDLEAPEASPLPMGYAERLTPFQQLLLFRCFRPDRVYNAVKLFVMGRMGNYYVEPPVLDYSRIFDQSTPTGPVVFVLSPGADPQSDIQKLGDSLGFTGHKFKFLALGQGQGGAAEQMIEAGYTRGHWVLLQNCHLLTSWLKTLEKVLEGMHKPHRDFRLWLTTEPTDKFPLGILQRSLKVVTEPPDGLKLNMRATYSRVTEEMLAEIPHRAFRPLLFVLCFYHAVVQERRKYGKIGWNVAYEFNESDFNISRRLLGLYLTKAFENGDDMIPWGSLKYLIGDAMYGGRVTDDFDRRCLTTYLSEYMGDFLFDDHQRFFFSRAGFDYTLPELGERDVYVSAVEELPLLAGPAVLGLHPNAEIGYFTNATKEMWRNLIELQPRMTGSSTGMSREEYIRATARDIESKIPEPTDLLVVQKILGDTPTPTEVVLLQELERWNVLVRRMKSSLVQLQQALVGVIGMSEELDALGASLYNGFLPSIWRQLAPQTEKPLSSWIAHFQRRFAQYTDWVDNGEPPVMWLSGLHVPESYLTALVQIACRKRNWPLDRSTLYTVVTDIVNTSDITVAPDYGCYITGLYLEGASWDKERSCMVRQDPKVLVIELPVMQVVPIEAAKLKLQHTFKTPVYVTQARRSAAGYGLVFEADLRTAEHPSHWTLQGVGLVLNVDT